MQSFIFGADGLPKTPQELARMRAVAEAMTPRRTPQNAGEGLSSIGNAILYRSLMGKADKAENAGIKSAEDAYSSLFSTPDVAPVDTAAVPPVDTTAAVPPIASPQDAVDASPQKPLTGDLAQTETYIRQSAQKRGIDPDYAVKVARSEGLAPGVWQSRVKKGDMYEPSYGPFQMLVGDGKTFPKGMGNDFQERTGLDPRDPKNANAMIDFALDTAKKDGWRQWYGAKKVGVNRWDGINANQVASLDADVPASAMLPKQEQVPVVAVPDGFQQPDPMAEQPVQVADSSNTIAPRKKVAQALSRLDPQKAFEVLNNPYLPEGRKETIRALLKQQFENENMVREQELKQADPLYRQNLKKGELEYNNLAHPKTARTLTDEEEKALNLPLDGVYQEMPDKTIKTVREGEAKLKPTSDMQEYDAYKADTIAAGGKPLGRLEYQQALRSASATRNEVNIDQKTEGAFDKKLAEKQAETFSTMADEGMNARADIDIVNQLGDFMKDQGGMGTGLSAYVSSWGIKVPDGDDLTAAKALINKLVPTQRQPGSGTMSDRDVELFKDSLPSLWNQPGGNEKILGVMRGLAEYKQRQGEIADQVIMGEMTRQEARRALREIPNPLEEFRKQQKAKKVEVDGYTIEEVE